MVGLLRTDMVGRAGPYADLTAVLTEAAAGHGGAAVLYGEAGIGKTRLLEEVVLAAQEADIATAWGRCTELEGVPPHWPWRQVLDGLGVVRATSGAARSREQLLSALLDAVGAADRPVLVCLEDVHWADADSRWLLRGAIDATAGRRLAVLCSWRTSGGDAELDGLPARVHRVGLTGLAPAAAQELAQAVAGGALSSAELTRAAADAGGNPLFLRELVRMRVAGGGDTRVPRGVRDVLVRRLARLPTRTVEAMTAAAVLGGDATVDLVAATLRTSPAAVLTCLAAAGDAGLTPATEAGGRVTFVHAVVREVLLEQAGPLGRATLHEQAARALEALAAAPDEALALHWSKASGAQASERAVRYGRTARDRARQLRALDQAVLFANLVWTVSGEVEDQLVLGDARARSGELAAARTDLLAVAQTARRTGRTDLLARAALALAAGEGGFEVPLADAEQIALLEEADRGLPPGGLRARVRARLAVATSEQATVLERTGLARSAVAEAEAAADRGALLHALASYADMIGGPRHVAERRSVADRMLALAREQADLDGELLARRFRLVALLETGDFAAADAEVAAFDRVARSTHEPAHQWYPPLWRGMQALLADRRADAEAAADAVDRIGRRAQSSNAEMLAATLRFATLWGSPEVVGLRPPVEQFVAGLGELRAPQVSASLSGLFAGLGDELQAARYYRPLADAGFGTLPYDAEFLSGLLGLSQVALALRDRTGAAALHDLLAPYSQLWIVDGIGAACWGVVAEWLARLEDLLDRPAEAGAHRAAAAAAYEQAHALGPLRRLAGADERVGGVEGELVREDGRWLLRWTGEHAVLPDLKGLHDLAVLLTRPGVPVPAATLLAGTAGLPVPVVGGGDDVLDAQAKAAYRNRLRELEDEIAAAEADGDLGTAQRRRDEREFLIRELSAALGLGGRARRLGDDTDRARKAVTMRLRDVIARLERSMPALGAHLRATVQTGRHCTYAVTEPVSWRVQV